jgi:hypothetical protein
MKSVNDELIFRRSRCSELTTTGFSNRVGQKTLSINLPAMRALSLRDNAAARHDTRILCLRIAREPYLVQVATGRWLFTLFKARSINFSNMVQSESMQLDDRLASNHLLGITEGNMAKKAKKTAKKKK